MANVARDALVLSREVADGVLGLDPNQVLLVDGSATGTKVVAVKLGAEKFQRQFETGDTQLLVASLVAADRHQSQNKP